MDKSWKSKHPIAIVTSNWPRKGFETLIHPTTYKYKVGSPDWQSVWDFLDYYLGNKKGK